MKSRNDVLTHRCYKKLVVKLTQVTILHFNLITMTLYVMIFIPMLCKWPSIVLCMYEFTLNEAFSLVWLNTC